MSTTTLAYRATVYAGRHIDPTEATVLAGSGAVHALQFKVATTSKLAGFYGYLHEVKVKYGEVDYLEARTTIPQASFTLRDQRLTEGGSNLIRFWTGLMGAAGGNGRFQQSRCKVVLEESLDWDEEAGTGTWNTIFTGRINLAAVRGILVKVTAQGMTKELLDARVFTRRPHASVTNAIESKVIPLGLSGAFGTIPAAPILRGTVGNSSSGVGKSIKFDATSQKHALNIITRALRARDGRVATIPRGGFSTMRPYDGTMRVRIVAPGPTSGDLRLLGYKMYHREEGHFSVVEVAIEALTVGTEQYIAIPADGTVVQVDLRGALSEPTKDAPLMLGKQHAGQYWVDMLDGKFGDLTSAGAVLRSWTRDAAAWATYLADTTVRQLAFIVDGPDKLMNWGQTNVNRSARLAIAEDELGQIEPVDLRIPTSLAGIVTLTDDDLIADEAPEWEHSADDAIQRFEVVHNVDDTWAPEDLTALPGFFPDVPASLIESYQVTTIEPDFSAGGGGQTLRLEAKGLRSTPGEINAAAAIHEQDRVQGDVIRLIEEYRTPFASGPQRTSATCRRTANVNGTKPGMWRLIQFSKLPDPSTNLRGGTRLVFVLDKSIDKGKVVLKFLDIGPNVVCTVPVIGALAAGPDAKHEVNIPVTVNATGDQVKVEVAYTSTGVGAAPADSSPLWTAVQTVKTSQTVVSRNGNPGMRCWVRIRSEPLPTARKAALPSPWVFAAPAFRDLTALSAFASLTVGTITSKAAVLTIGLGGNVTDWVRILISSAATKVLADATTPVKLIDLPPGSTSFQLSGLDQAGPWYKVQAAPFDGIVTVGTPVGIAATSFQATGTPVKWPKLAGVTPLGGTTIIPAVKAYDLANQVARTGVAFNLLPGQLGLDIKVQRAPDVAGVPGSPVDFDTVPAYSIPKEGKAWVDELPTGTPYHYRFAHTGDGGDDSDWTEYYRAFPGLLPRETLLLKSPGGVPRDRPMAGGARSVLQLQTWIWPNAEMDLWEADGITPAGHAVDLAGSAVVSRVAAPNSGDYALKYKNPDNATNSGWHGLSTNDPVKGAFCMPMRPGARYRILASVRSSVISNGERFRVVLDFSSGGVNQIIEEFVFNELDRTAGVYGLLFEFPFTCPSSAEANAKGTIQFNRNGNAGDVEFELDSIRVDEETTDYETLSQQLQDQGYSIAVNGDFERGRSNWEEFKGTASTSVLSVDTSTFDKGTKALKVTVTVNGTQTLIRQSRRTSDKHSKTLDTDASTLLATRVRQGDVVQVRGSVRLSSSGPSVYLGVRYYGGSAPSGAGTGVLIGQAGSASIGAFEQLLGWYVVPSGVSWIVPYIQIDSQNVGHTIWIDDIVIGRLLTLPKVKVYNPTGTDIATVNNTVKIITFSTEMWDIGGFHSTSVNTSRLTIPGAKYDGYFDICAQVVFEANTNNYRRLRILKNGSQQLAMAHYEAVSVDMGCQIFAQDNDPSPGDYYELEVLQTSGGALNVLGGHDTAPNPDLATHTWFAMAFRR